MNPAHPHHAANGAQPPAGFSADDAIYTLFRHKWLIAGFVCLGLIGAVAARLVKPPLYISKAKLMVQNVVNSREMTPAAPDSPHAQIIDASVVSIINAEIDIITSLDVAMVVADAIGPEKILAKKGGGTNRIAAAGVICSGIEVDPPKSSILTISFKHPDADVVQPVLEALLKAYMFKHQEVREMPAEYLVRQSDTMRKKLEQTEEEIKALKIGAKMPFPEDANRSIQRQIAKVQDDLLDAQRELLERKAMLGDKAFGSASETNGIHISVPADKLSSYSLATTKLEELKRQENDLLLQFTAAHPVVQNVHGRIEKLTRENEELEKQCPGLANLFAGGAHLGTNTVPTAVLIARVQTLGTVLTNLQGQAAQIMDVQPKIAELERRRTEEQRAYDSVINRLDQQRSTVDGKSVNMSQVQSATPPGLDYKKTLKLVGAVLAGCIGMGVGLAFLIDKFLDRSIKRASDIERHLRVPVFLSIPDTASHGWLHLPRWLAGSGRARAGAPNGAGGGSTGGALVPWDPAHQMQTFAEGLRERVISYFEVQNLNLKKPKLVAVTGCGGGGAGVSTLASGLAAALSKTGDGNVLLVDMNADQGSAHSFYKGKPGGMLSDVLEPDGRAEAQVQENLYMATLNEGSNNQLVKVLPTRFTHLMPKLKASDYDYIVFDMPAVTQTSATPRLAGHMDLALLVVEAEKTSQHSAARASGLLREARANVAAVLNKHRSHMPAVFSQEG